MKRISDKARDGILRALDSVFSIAVLPFGLFMVDDRADVSNYLRNRLFTAALFLTFSLSLLCQGLRRKYRSQRYGWQLTQSAISLVAVVLVLTLPSSDIAMPLVTLILAFMLIGNRVLSIVRNHSYRNVLFNMACILLVAAATYLVNFYAIFAYMMILNLGHIASLSFSGMDMKILSKVIRKTYALDVLSGLLLMMTAFSFMFPVLEGNITTFKDALWYCFAVVTTIGFGDFTTTTDVGRIMSALLGAYGIVVVALITSVVVNFYSEVKALPEDEEGEDVEIGEGE